MNNIDSHDMSESQNSDNTVISVNSPNSLNGIEMTNIQPIQTQYLDNVIAANNIINVPPEINHAIREYPAYEYFRLVIGALTIIALLVGIVGTFLYAITYEKLGFIIMVSGMTGFASGCIMCFCLAYMCPCSKN